MRGCQRGYEILTRASGAVRLTPAVVKDQVTLFQWTVRLHNAVNAKLHKPVDPDWGRWYRLYDGARG